MTLSFHVDFAAVFFGHAMLYHLLRGFGRDRPGHIVLGVLFGSLGFAIKAPYLFYLYLPLGLYLVWRRIWARPLRAWLPLLALPVLAFALWRWHSSQVNLKPPSPVYPQYVDRAAWYFGALAERLDPTRWLILLQRLIFDVANPLGVLLAAWGAWGWLRARRQPVVAFAASWLLGAALYLLTFFSLNWMHSYYQIPLLAPVALLAAAFLDRLAAAPRLVARLGAVALLLAMGAVSLWYTSRAYYHVDWRAVHAGELIRSHTAPDDLIVAYLYDDNRDYADPRLLYQARRRGWPVQALDLVPERIQPYVREGAAHLAVVEATPDPRLRPPWLAALPARQFPLRHGEQDLGILRLYDLAPLAGAAHSSVPAVTAYTLTPPAAYTSSR